MRIFSSLDQFEVTNLLSIYAPILGNFNISLTNLGLYCIIALLVIHIRTEMLNALEYKTPKE